MLIQFGAAKDALTKENKNLDTKMDQAQRQIGLIEGVSLEDCGLTGAAYSTLDFRLKRRTAILKAHYVAYQEIQAANGSNISALSNLVAMDGKDAVDPGACDLRIKEAETTKNLLLAAAEKQKEKLRKTSSMMSDGYGAEGKSSPPISASIAQINRFYGNVISVQDRIIEVNRKALEAYEKYEGAAASIYEGAAGKVRAILNQADELGKAHAIGADTYDFFAAIDTDYRVSQIRAKIIVDGVVNEAYVRGLFSKNELNSYEKQALGMAYVDLGESSRKGYKEQLNIFLNLGFTNGNVRRVGYENNTSAQAYLVERTMRPGFFEFLLYYSNPGCSGYNYYAGNSEFQDIKNYLSAICSCLLQVGNYTFLTYATSAKDIDYTPLNSDIDIRFAGEKKLVGENKDVREEDIKLLHINLKHDRIYIPGSKNSRDDNFFKPSIYFEVTYSKSVSGNAADMQGYYTKNSIEDPASQAVYGATVGGLSSLIPFDKLFSHGGFYGTLYSVVDGGKSAYFDALKNNENYEKIGNLGQLSDEAQNHFITQGAVIHAVGLEGIGSSKTYLLPDQSDYEIRCEVQAQKDYSSYLESSTEKKNLGDWLNDEVTVEKDSPLYKDTRDYYKKKNPDKEVPGKIPISRREYIELKVGQSN